MMKPQRRLSPPRAPGPDDSLSIGDLTLRTGTKATTVRWYEAVGLLPAAARTAGGHRAYSAAHLARLDFIRHAREFGFPLDAVRALLGLADHPDQGCAEAHLIAVAQLAETERRLVRLTALRDELQRLAAACDGGRPSADCRILEVLSDHTHGQCLSADHGAGSA